MKRVFLVFATLILLSISVIGVVFFMTEEEEGLEETSLQYTMGPDGRMNFQIVDHSIMRGLEEDEMIERIRPSLGNPRINDRTIYYDHGFRREIRYYLENGMGLSLRTKYYRGMPHSHRFSVDIDESDVENGGFSLDGSIGSVIGFCSVFLGSFDCDLTGNEIFRNEENDQGTWISVFQKWDGVILSEPGIQFLSREGCENITRIRFNNWLCMVEIGEPIMGMDQARERILEYSDETEDLVKVPFRMRVDGEPIIWSEVVQYPLNESEIEFSGYMPVAGRLCLEVSVEYMIEGNHSHFHRSHLDGESFEVMICKPYTFRHRWKFDVETGKILEWIQETDDWTRYHTFYNNLIGDGSTWPEDYIENILGGSIHVNIDL